jgi:dipeptidase E
MRLLLTSNGLHQEAPAIVEKFFELCGKDPSYIKVAFIPTASVVEDNRDFMVRDRKGLEEIGIPMNNITNLELNHVIALEELSNHDVVYVDGGNTFYLLEKVRQSGFDTAIKEYLDQDLGVFVGVSAGTILMGPDIGFVKPWDDPNKASLEDTKGLGYTKDAYSPHYESGEDDEILANLRPRVDYVIRELRNGQAILVNETVEKIVG